MKKVAVTGSLASGKTTVCRYFEESGAYVVSADEVVHQLLTPYTEIGHYLIEVMGDEIVEGKRLSREVLAKKVFKNPSLLEKIENRIHPEVQKVVESKYLEALTKKSPLFVVEMPLLFESSQESFYDLIIVVGADRKRRVARFTKSMGYDESEFERREKRQLPFQEKAARADYLIENNGDLETLHEQVATILKEIHEPREFNG